MKKWIYFMIAVVFVAGGVLSIAIAQGDKVTIDNKYPRDLKSPVTFSHKGHADQIACTECHHTWKKDERKTPQKCVECHKTDDTGDKGAKKVYHKQCWTGCHKDLAAQGKPTGPTKKCSECHPSAAKSVR